MNYINNNKIQYLYIYYLLYGPAMLTMTYVLSYTYNSESVAQISIILLNLFLGAFGSTVTMLLRLQENTRNDAKVIQYIISLLPSFSFNFGYLILLNRYMLLAVEYDDWYLKKESFILTQSDLALGPILYLAIETVVFTIIFIIIESILYSYYKVNNKIKLNIRDSKVLKEIGTT